MGIEISKTHSGAGVVRGPGSQGWGGVFHGTIREGSSSEGLGLACEGGREGGLPPLREGLCVSPEDSPVLTGEERLSSWELQGLCHLCSTDEDLKHRQTRQLPQPSTDLPPFHTQTDRDTRYRQTQVLNPGCPEHWPLLLSPAAMPFWVTFIFWVHPGRPLSWYTGSHR